MLILMYCLHLLELIVSHYCLPIITLIAVLTITVAITTTIPKAIDAKVEPIIIPRAQRYLTSEGVYSCKIRHCSLTIMRESRIICSLQIVKSLVSIMEFAAAATITIAIIKRVIYLN